MGNTSNHTRWAAVLRLAWIERSAQRNGGIGRGAIMEAFSVGSPQASADIQALLALHPGCLTYDFRAKYYQWTGGDVLMTQIPYPVIALDLGSA